MVLHVTLLFTVMVISGILAAALTVIAWRHRDQPVVQPFILLMADVTIWAFGDAYQLTGPGLPAALLTNDIQYLAYSTIGIAWLFLVLIYTGRGHYLTRRTVPLFFIIPAIVCILVITNPLHHLYYTGFLPQDLDGTTIWLYLHGPLFWIHIAYAYLIGLAALILAAGKLFGPTDLYRRQTLVMTLAAGIPIFTNMAYAFQIVPFPRYDLTAVAFLASGILIAIGILRFQLFSSVPVAYSYVFSSMRDGVIVTDSKYQVIDLNPAAGQITGISSRGAIGRPLAGVFPALEGMIAAAVQDGGERRVEITAPRDGTPRIYDVTVTPMGAAGTTAAGYLFLFRDITERKEVELALGEANRKIGLLTSITRHDITNKLMAVYSYQALARELSTDPVQQEYLDLEEKALNAMSAHLEFTREYQQLGTQAPAWQDPAGVIGWAKSHVNFGKIALQLDIGGFEVLADPMLEHVFSNLFDNAIKYGGAGLTSISVSSHPAGTGLVIVVEDNGKGIAGKDKSRLFERGFGQHTGLGLFLSREILSITNIAIRETSEPGQGARFEITVPAGRFRPADRTKRSPAGFLAGLE
jgi:PAS domain S-box-containing protein